MALTQLTRAEIADVTKAVENYKLTAKRQGRKVTATGESDVRKKMEASIIRRRKGGL